MVVPVRFYGDDPHHRRSEVVIRVLNPAVWAGSDRLTVAVEMRVKSTIVDKSPALVESQDERSGLTTVAVGAGKQVVGAVVSRRVEYVVAHDRMIVGILVHPFHTVTSTDRQSKREESIFPRGR